MPLKGMLAAIPTILRQPWNKQSDCPQNRMHLIKCRQAITNVEALLTHSTFRRITVPLRSILIL